MAKLVSPKAELAVLRGMCSKNKALAGSLIAQTDETYFYHDESKELYKAIRKHVIKVGHPPSYQTVLEDLRISEEARDHFKLSRRSIRTVEDVDAAVTVLNRYRQTRGILEIADYINTKLKKSSIDADLMLSDITEALTSVKTKKSMEDTIVHFGRNNSSRELVKEIIYGDNTENVIPTGLRTFDERNGGFLRGSLVTIGGNSGAGKTLVANAICMNMSVLGYSVLYVPLEMSKREMTARMLARISGVDLLKILLNKLTDREKELVNRRYRKFIRTVRNAGGRYTVFRPKEDMTLEEIYSAAAAYQCDVKCVDYLTLLKGMDGDDQWRQLGNATRYSKIDAENSNSVNMVLAQVSDEGKIRYSGAVREHCVTGDTLIDTDKGLVRIDSLYADAKIASTKTLHGINVKSEGVYRPASHVHYNGVRPVYEVVLSNGMTIRSTSQHRYRFLNKSLKVSWERLENLRVGDTIAIDNTKGKFGNSHIFNIPRFSPHFNSKDNVVPTKLKIDPSFGYLLGALAGDGYIGKYGTQFIASDKAIFDKYVKIWNKFFPTTGTERESVTPNGCPIWRHHAASSEVTRFLASIEGMSGGSKNKYVPDILLASSHEVVREYLAGLFDADGSAQLNLVTVCSYSKHQRQRVQLLLASLGIRSRNSKKGLAITGENLYKFIKLIKLTKAKADRITPNKLRSFDRIPRIFVSSLESDWKCTSPRMKKRSKEAHALLKKLKREVGLRYNHSPTMGNLEYKDILDIKNTLLGSYREGFIDDLVSYSHNRFVEIESITKVGEEKVYDLTVPETENYVANGIVVHNSSNGWTFTANQETKEQGILKISQIKSRNQDHFPFTLKVDYPTMDVRDLPPDEVIETSPGKKSSDRTPPNLAPDV